MKTYTYQHVVNHVWPAPRLLPSHPVFPPLSFSCTPNKNPVSDSVPRTYVLILQLEKNPLCHMVSLFPVTFGSLQDISYLLRFLLTPNPTDRIWFCNFVEDSHWHCGASPCWQGSSPCWQDKVSPLMDRMLPCRKRWSQGSADWCRRTSIPKSWTCATYVSLAEVHCNQWLTSYRRLDKAKTPQWHQQQTCRTSLKVQKPALALHASD